MAKVHETLSGTQKGKEQLFLGPSHKGTRDSKQTQCVVV